MPRFAPRRALIVIDVQNGYVRRKASGAVPAMSLRRARAHAGADRDGAPALVDRADNA